MEKSVNVLWIDSIDAQQVERHGLIYVEASMNARIDISCGITGNTFQSVFLQADGKGHSINIAVKDAIENFLNGKSNVVKQHIYHVSSKSLTCLDKIHGVDYNGLSEPFYSLFEALFDLNKWEIEKTLEFTTA